MPSSNIDDQSLKKFSSNGVRLAFFSDFGALEPWLLYLVKVLIVDYQYIKFQRDSSMLSSNIDDQIFKKFHSNGVILYIFQL